jgi:phosphoglycolate phosphatase
LVPFFPDVPDLLGLLNEEAIAAPQAPAVDLQPFLAELKDMGLHLGVATNDAIEPALAHLEEAGVVGAFDFIAGYDSGYGGKPGPGQLHAFCEATGLAARDCAMVGDSLTDLEAGRAAGMIRVGVLTGMADHADLAPFADVVLPNIGDLPGWLIGRENRPD